MQDTPNFTSPFHDRSVRPVQNPVSTGVYYTTSSSALANSLTVYKWCGSCISPSRIQPEMNPSGMHDFMGKVISFSSHCN